jgi:CHAD domain-containing protein
MKKKVSLDWDGGRTAGENARRHLPPLVRQYFAAGRNAVKEGASPKQLHQFRLATKRLRYTLELFRPVYGPGLHARLGQLRKVQDLLGSLNDHAVTAARLEPRARTEPALHSVLDHLQKGAASRQSEFHQHWQKTFGRPGAEAAWTNYLARNAGGRRPKPPAA